MSTILPLKMPTKYSIKLLMIVHQARNITILNGKYNNHSFRLCLLFFIRLVVCYYVYSRKSTARDNENVITCTISPEIQSQLFGTNFLSISKNLSEFPQGFR